MPFLTGNNCCERRNITKWKAKFAECRHNFRSEGCWIDLAVDLAASRSDHGTWLIDTVYLLHWTERHINNATFTCLQICLKGAFSLINGSILMADESKSDITALTVQLLSAFVSKNTVSSENLAELIKTTRAALTEDLTPAANEAPAQEFVPAVSVRKSLSSPDHVISLIDGKPYKTLKRHLATHGLTPEQYRERYKLPKSYPLVAASYSDARRAVAERLGLGRKPAAASVPTNVPAVEAPAAAESKNAAGKAPAKAAKPKASAASAEKGEVKVPAAAKAAPRKRLSIAFSKEEKSPTPPIEKAESPGGGSKTAKPRTSAAKAVPAPKVKAANKPKSSKANTKAAAANVNAKVPEPTTN
ncbi:MucR family transcriptional regulator [Sphingobium tyrosinilyticum]|uniref:MucR family transcriptional regulator n=1 Tax=Sphingobium tyrosinilyticum TaxID=2715436 RepID=A0ABV9F4U4_9SPHN